MRSWSRPAVPRLPGHGAVPRIYDTATRQLIEARPIAVAGLYVCGITPYDATHSGHAATYFAYDTLRPGSQPDASTAQDGIAFAPWAESAGDRHP